MTQSQPLVLYWHILSEQSRAIKSLLDMSEVQCKYVSIDLFKQQNKKHPYTSINPIGNIPTLVDCDIVITQTNAILLYLCQKYQVKLGKFYAKGLEQKALINSFLSWNISYFQPAISSLYNLKFRTGVLQRKLIPFLQIQTAQSRISEALQHLNRVLEQKQYLVSNQISIADISIYFVVTILVYYGKTHFEYPNIDRWFKNVYGVHEVKIGTHMWFGIAQQMAKIFGELPVKTATL